MSKLLSSAALALVLTLPGWAQAAGDTDQSERSKTEAGSTAAGETGTGMDGTAATDELYSAPDDDTAAADDDLPDVSDSQPGVITGDDVQADEGQPAAGAGSTD